MACLYGRSHYTMFIFIKGMEHVPNIFISFDKYLFLEVIKHPHLDRSI